MPSEGEECGYGNRPHQEGAETVRRASMDAVWSLWFESAGHESPVTTINLGCASLPAAGHTSRDLR